MVAIKISLDTKVMPFEGTEHKTATDIMVPIWVLTLEATYMPPEVSASAATAAPTPS